MRIRFERSGGFTGISRSATIESSELAQEDGEELRRLVDEAQFFELPATPPSSVADAFRYTITIEREDRSWTVTTSDATAPVEVRRLIEWLNRAARSTP